MATRAGAHLHCPPSAAPVTTLAGQDCDRDDDPSRVSGAGKGGALQGTSPVCLRLPPCLLQPHGGALPNEQAPTAGPTAGASVCTVPSHSRRHGEPFNVLRYELSQHYDSHYDSFGAAWLVGALAGMLDRSLCRATVTPTSCVRRTPTRFEPALRLPAPAAEEDYGPQSSQRVRSVLPRCLPPWAPRPSLRACWLVGGPHFLPSSTTTPFLWELPPATAGRHGAGLSVGCGGGRRDQLPAGGQGRPGAPGHHRL